MKSLSGTLGHTDLRGAMTVTRGDNDSRITGSPATPPAQRHSVFAGGLQWHVKRQGQGRKVLLIHGTGSSIHSWDGLFPELASGYQLLAPDLPGHGDTLGASDSDLTLEGMSMATGTLLSRLEFEPEFVIGHSAGAAVLLNMCCNHAIRPRQVIGINAALIPYGGRLAPVFRPIARLFASMPGVSGLVAARAGKPGAVERLISGSGSKLDKQQIDQYRRLLSSGRHVTSTLTMMASWRLEGLLDRFAGTRIPLTLLVGDQDRMVEPWQAESAAAVIKHARIVHLDALGHLAHEENPGAVAGAILKILSGCEQA